MTLRHFQSDRRADRLMHWHDVHTRPEMFWRGSSAPADSPRWLGKHFSGYNTLLFFPSAVSTCSLSLNTTETTSLARGLSEHDIGSKVSVMCPGCDPLRRPMKMNEKVLFRASRGLFCLHRLSLSVSIPQLFLVYVWGVRELWVVIVPAPSHCSGPMFDV